MIAIRLLEIFFDQHRRRSTCTYYGRIHANVYGGAENTVIWSSIQWRSVEIRTVFDASALYTDDFVAEDKIDTELFDRIKSTIDEEKLTLKFAKIHDYMKGQDFGYLEDADKFKENDDAMEERHL